MQVFIAIILALIFFGVIACVERVGEIEDLLRDEVKPFLREEHEPRSDDMWPEVKPKKGKK